MGRWAIWAELLRRPERLEYITDRKSLDIHSVGFCCRRHTEARNDFDEENRLVQLMILQVSWFTRTYGILTTVPNNMVAKLGDRVEFECSINETDSSGLYTYVTEEASPLEWTFFPAASSTEEFIYQSGYVPQNFSSKYRITSDKKQGVYNLVINSVDLSFAGTYKCSEPPFGYKELHMVSAELIVIASDPVCSYSANRIITKGDYISMWCTVNYRGNWIPLMEWTTINGQNAHADIRYTNSSTSFASMLITQLDVNDSEVTFTCKTSFKPMTTNIRTTLQGVVPAANVPHYQHFWNYTATISLGSSTTHTPALNDGLFAIIGIVLGGVILSIATVTIIYKLRKGDNLVIPRSTDETSSETKEHEMTAKLIRQMGDSISSPVHLSTSNEEGRENQSEDNIGHEVYSSLQRDQSDSFAQRDVYAKLQIYANTNFKET